ncbi:ERF family protein [uncultured Acinetobacter sp.]|uniref:ERF family protein n=1 Tax=uncultured Acinetobacter sp. TaxID=165433 RepID=UPI00258D6ECE|nr:ERF family protein [uncultured Acinetobacter sp.]
MNAQVNSINTTNALVEIQHELKAPKDKFNNFGKYHYRSCESILEALKPLLVKYGCTLVLTDESKELCGIPVVIATAKFTDGNGKETIVKAEAGVEVSKKGMDIAQTFGTSSSYARKYALNGLFLIDDSKDADTDEYQNQQGSNNNQAQKTQNNQLHSDYQRALSDIRNAQSKDVLVNAWNYFKSTQYAKEIENATKAKRDQMGWE